MSVIDHTFRDPFVKYVVEACIRGPIKHGHIRRACKQWRAWVVPYKKIYIRPMWPAEIQLLPPSLRVAAANATTVLCDIKGPRPDEDITLPVVGSLLPDDITLILRLYSDGTQCARNLVDFLVGVLPHAKRLEFEIVTRDVPKGEYVGTAHARMAVIQTVVEAYDAIGSAASKTPEARLKILKYARRTEDATIMPFPYSFDCPLNGITGPFGRIEELIVEERCHSTYVETGYYYQFKRFRHATLKRLTISLGAGGWCFPERGPYWSIELAENLPELEVLTMSTPYGYSLMEASYILRSFCGDTTPKQPFRFVLNIRMKCDPGLFQRETRRDLLNACMTFLEMHPAARIVFLEPPYRDKQMLTGTSGFRAGLHGRLACQFIDDATFSKTFGVVSRTLRPIQNDAFSPDGMNWDIVDVSTHFHDL